MMTLVSGSTRLPAGLIGAFAILDGFGPVVCLSGGEPAGRCAQRLQAFGLAGLAQPVDVGGRLLKPLRREDLQLLDNGVNRAHRLMLTQDAAWDQALSRLDPGAPAYTSADPGSIGFLCFGFLRLTLSSRTRVGATCPTRSRAMRRTPLA